MEPYLPVKNDVLVTCYVTEGPIWSDSIYKECSVNSGELRLPLPETLDDLTPGMNAPVLLVLFLSLFNL
jgi:hypothetical protein